MARWCAFLMLRFKSGSLRATFFGTFNACSKARWVTHDDEPEYEYLSCDECHVSSLFGVALVLGCREPGAVRGRCCADCHPTSKHVFDPRGEFLCGRCERRRRAAFGAYTSKWGHAANGPGDEPCVAASAGTRRDHDTAARSSRATYAEVRLDAYAK